MQGKKAKLPPAKADALQDVADKLNGDHAVYARQALKIRDKYGKTVPFELQPAQERLDAIIADCKRKAKPVRIIVLKARQVMISTGVAAQYFQAVAAAAGQRARIIAHNEDSAHLLFGYYHQFYANYTTPVGGTRLRNVVTDAEAEGLLEFDNGSSFQIQTAGNVQAGRGGSFRFLHLSEFAFWRDAKTVMTAIMQTVPKDADTCVIIESTANGVGGEFHRLWMEATDPASESDWIAFFFAWWEHPEYQIPVEDAAAFTASLDADEIALQQAYNLTLAQLNWRRWCIRNNCGNSIDTFKQEYPACVTAETRVSTEKGLVRIQDVSDCHFTESGAITMSGPQPMSQIYRLTTRQGRILRGTFDHPVATPDGEFIFLSKLAPGQKIQLRPPRFAEKRCRVQWGPIPGAQCSVEIDEVWGRLLGFFVGDGSWHADTFSVVCDARDGDVISLVEETIRSTVGRAHARRHARVQGHKGAVEWRLGCKAAREVLEQVGVLRSVNGTGYKRDVCVPEAIFQSPKPVVRAFLQALFESDGSASGHKVRVASSNLPFLRDVQLLLLGFGINSRLWANHKKAGDGHPYHCWQLELGVEASKLFYQHIGFLSERKRTLNQRHGAGPLTKKGKRWGRPPAPNDLTDEVESVVEDGFEITYDLTVEPDHVFSANGILTHNTPTEAFLFSGRPRFSHKHLNRMPVDSAGLVGDLDEVVNGPTTRLWFAPSDRGYLWVHKKPQEGRAYVIGADSAEGIDPIAQASPGQSDPDYSAAVVLDRDTGEQVATLRGRLENAPFGEYLAVLGRWYNWAFQIPEANAAGIATIDALLRAGYPPGLIYHRMPAADERFSPEQAAMRSKIGWKTTNITRVQLISRLDQAIRDYSIYITCPRTMSELQTFVRKANGREEAMEGCHDDLCIASGLAWVGIQEAPADGRLAQLKKLREGEGLRQQAGTAKSYAPRRSDDRGSIVRL